MWMNLFQGCKVILIYSYKVILNYSYKVILIYSYKVILIYTHTKSFSFSAWTSKLNANVAWNRMKHSQDTNTRNTGPNVAPWDTFSTTGLIQDAFVPSDAVWLSREKSELIGVGGLKTETAGVIRLTLDLICNGVSRTMDLKVAKTPRMVDILFGLPQIT